MNSDDLFSPSFRKFRTSGFEFDVLARYDIQKFCGYGAFGVVTSAVDTVTGTTVAIKKIVNAMTGSTKCKQTLREIKLMKRFHHENITSILDLIPPQPEKLEFEDLYIVEDLMETDLHRVIYSRQDLSIDHTQCFIYQILRGLKYLHSANVIHRDLKPSNILVNSNCDIKICDFGLSCLAEDENQLDKTEYVVTRWYRAPEVMLKRTEYTKAIDIWSVGCILAELLAREPLFPGVDYLKQLEIICSKLGKPKGADLDFVTSQRAREYIASLPVDDKPKHLSDLFPKYKESNMDVLDLLSKMLKFPPDERITVLDSLKHPFLSSMHSEDDEPVADFYATFDFENESTEGKSEESLIQRYKQLIWDEIREFHPNLQPTLPVPVPVSTPNTSNSPFLLPKKSSFLQGIQLSDGQSHNLYHDVNRQDMADFGSMSGCSSVATVVTNKANMSIARGLPSVFSEINGNNMNHDLNSSAIKRQLSASTPMSPPTSVPTKRFRP